MDNTEVKETQVSAQMSDLQLNINHLEENLVTLRERLHSVMKQTVEEKEETLKDQKALCPLADNIRDQRMRIEELTKLVNNIMFTLEV